RTVSGGFDRLISGQKGTAMTYTVDENRIGSSPIAGIDAGLSYTSPAGVTTITPTPPAMLGNIVRGFDPVLGEGEFICLKGVVGTVVGSCVVWDANYATSLAASAAGQARPVAFAMSANVDPNKFGWYQISGQVIAAKDTAAAINANVAVGVTAAGLVGPSAAGIEIEGARSTNTATVLAATTTVPLYVDRPALQGRIT
ncbi:MAG TPA: hypothetical protein VGR76_09020, partial [Candidatus Angelobacter sp.]|nr:hypothetical protein [Candidatus Angelobacter sp.]